jgi:hypothetical protein
MVIDYKFGGFRMINPISAQFLVVIEIVSEYSHLHPCIYVKYTYNFEYKKLIAMFI